MNGDLLTDLNFAELLRWHQAGMEPLSIATYQKPVNISLGVLDTNEHGRVIGFREKPTLHFPCSMGVYVMNPEILDLIPDDTPFGFDQLMYKMLEMNVPARSYDFRGTWMDIGRPEDFHEACEVFEKNPERFLPHEYLKKAG